MTTAQLAKILNMTERGVMIRCQKLGMPKTFVKSRWIYYLNYEQQDAVINMRHKVVGIMKDVVERVEFIRIETTYYIYPSKMNYLEIVTNRENTNKKHIKSTSKYVGVCFCKTSKKWLAYITFGSKQKNLGRYNSELEASNAYQKALLKSETTTN